jgi:HD-like signal output (HDOD) protein
MGKLLTVGMAFPLDVATIRSLEDTTGLRVKALLCNPVDIRNAIQHYYISTPETAEAAEREQGQIDSGVRVESVAALIRQIDVLPTLPQTVQQVQEAATSPDSSAKEVAKIVSRDPAISGKLLKLANSAAYGFTHQVDNVELATSLLGLRETIMAVTSSAVVTLTEGSSHFDHEAYWRQSTMCAVAAKKIGEASGLKKMPGLFTAGLLCEIGRFALCESAPERYAKISKELSDAEMLAAEEKVFGIGHAEAGYLLAEHWGLPPDLVEPIRFHLAPDQAQACPEITSVVAIAARCVDARVRGENADPAVLFESLEPAIQRLGLAVDDLVGVLETLENV